MLVTAPNGSPGGSDGKISACNVGDPGSIPGLGKICGDLGEMCCAVPKTGWRSAWRWFQGGAFRMSSSLRLALGLDRPGLELGLLSRVPAKGWAPGSC